MKAIYIHRHDEALRKLLLAINKGNHGSYYTIADIGCAEKTGHLGVHDKRIPEWILPETTLTALERERTRPDIMHVEMNTSELTEYTEAVQGNLSMTAPLSTSIGGRPRKVWVVEGAYCSDTNIEEKICQKSQQHKDLLKKLSSHGYKVFYSVVASFWGERNIVQANPRNLQDPRYPKIQDRYTEQQTPYSRTEITTASN